MLKAFQKSWLSFLLLLPWCFPEFRRISLDLWSSSRCLSRKGHVRILLNRGWRSNVFLEVEKNLRVHCPVSVNWFDRTFGWPLEKKFKFKNFNFTLTKMQILIQIKPYNFLGSKYCVAQRGVTQWVELE